jgi:RND superfamily putative drug exporter
MALATTDAMTAAGEVPARSGWERLAAFVLRHRRTVIGFWLVILLIGAASAGQVSKHLSINFSLPGQPGYETAQQVTHIYGNGGQQAPAIAVVSVPPGQSVQADEPAIASAFDQVRAS